MKIFEFSTDVSEMSEGELRATLVDLVAKHNEQVGETDDYAAQIEGLEADLESYREDAESARAFFSELVGAQKDMDPEKLAEKFTVGELREEVDMSAFAQDTEGGDEEGDDASKFSDKPEKSDNLPSDDDMAQYRTDARDALTRMGIAAFDN